jgi:hypothetical protein
MEEKLTDKEIEGYNAKHKRIRGSLALKYPPKESRCGGECGRLDYRVEIRGREQVKHHPCVLAESHKGECEFSSECVTSPHCVHVESRAVIAA